MYFGKADILHSRIRCLVVGAGTILMHPCENRNTRGSAESKHNIRVQGRRYL
jgi:hypothetical protein